jgi:hypothetical protein
VRALNFRRLVGGAHASGAVVALFLSVVILRHGRDQALALASAELADAVLDDSSATGAEADGINSFGS